MTRLLLSFCAAALFLSALTSCAMMNGIQGEPTHSRQAVSASPTPMPTEEVTPTPIIDSGPREMATGSATPNSDGSLTYVVADGDVGGVICDRFGLSWQQMQFVDGRKGDTCFASVYPGEVVNLSSARDGEVPD
jgi:hypothetical protein